MLHYSSSYISGGTKWLSQTYFFLPYPLDLVNRDNQKFVVSRYIGSWGFVGMSTFNFKVHGLWYVLQAPLPVILTQHSVRDLSSKSDIQSTYGERKTISV